MKSDLEFRGVLRGGSAVDQVPQQQLCSGFAVQGPKYKLCLGFGLWGSHPNSCVWALGFEVRSSSFVWALRFRGVASAHIRRSGTDSGPGLSHFQVKVFTTCEVVPSWLDSGADALDQAPQHHLRGRQKIVLIMAQTKARLRS